MRNIREAGSRLALTFLVVLGAFSFSDTAFAWDGQVSGLIFQIDVTDGNSLGFRVYLSTNSMCGTSANWAYLNSSDSNYSAYTAALLMAKATNANVIVYSNQDSNGYCHIGYVALQ